MPTLTVASRAIRSMLRFRSIGVTIMTTEDKSQMPLFSPEDEKEAQKELERLRKRLRENENGVFKVNTVNRKRTGFEDKTLWDWLDLLAKLAIPIVVLGATIGFGWWQVHLVDLQHQSDQQLALDQQQESTLKTYLDDMSDLLLNHNLGNSKSGDEVRQVARVRTLTTLRRLKADRNQVVLKFLQDAHLLSKESENAYHSVVDLSNANLSGDDLRSVNLTYTFLIGSYLYRADLSDADMSGTDMNSARLNGANLTYAGFLLANLTNAMLGCITLDGAKICTDLSDADLCGADLSDADLNGADLTYVNMSCTLLANIKDYTNLSGANLSGVNLERSNITQRQLDQVKTCLGAILPPGLTCHHNQ
jgi:uncharacterized protein YjbI with pentapeptide repeats